MAQSDDPTVYHQTWREGDPTYVGQDGQTYAQPVTQDASAQPGYAPQQPMYQQQTQPVQGYGEPQYAEPQPTAQYAEPQPADPYAQQGYAQPQAQNPAPHDPYAASYDQHAAAVTQPHYAPEAAPAVDAYGQAYAAEPQTQTYAAEPQTYSPQHQAVEQTYAPAPQQWDAGQQPVTQPAAYQQPDPYTQQPQGYATQPVGGYEQPAQAQYHDPNLYQQQPATYDNGQAGDAFSSLQHDPATGGAGYSEFGQTQAAGHAQPEAIDPYAFPQPTETVYAPMGDALGVDRHGGGAYFDPSQAGSGDQFGHGGGLTSHQEPQFLDAGHGQQPQGHEQFGQDAFGQTHDQQAYGQVGDGHYDEMGGVDPAMADAAMAPSSSRRGLIVVGALVAAVGVGGALGFAYKYSNDGGTREASFSPPTIKANKLPPKIVPKNAGGKTFANQQKSIYTKLETNRAAEKSETRLVSREETLDSLDLRANTSGKTGNGQAKVTSLQGERLNVPGVRRVKTARVNPDGSFAFPTPTSGSGNSVPGLTIGSLASSSDQAVAAIKPKVRKVAATLPKTIKAPKRVAVIPTPKAAAPKKRVASLGSSVPATASSGGGLGFVVQVSARRSRIDALAAFADLQQRHSSALSNKQPDIQEVNLGSRGKWYRVRIGPPGSKNAAYNLCGKLKKSGLKDCIVKVYQ